MAVPSQIPQVIRFGIFEADINSGELFRNGLRVRIQEQSFQILLALLQRPNQIVTREELRKQLWPTETFVDFDNGLNKNVAKLRELLGDSAESPRYIETLARKGYRFIYPVDGLNNGRTGLSEVSHPEGAVAAAHAPSYKLFWVAVVVAVLVVAAVVYVRVPRQRAQVAPPAKPTSLAVMPFQNLTGDPQQDYFADGLTEEMITQIGGFAPTRLAVIARTSAMHYKGSTERAAEIGRELNVDYLLEGSVRREGPRVRVSVQLIRLPDETHVWAQEYDRKLQNYLQLEEEIATTVAGQIEVTLAKRVAGYPRPMLDPSAHDDYLKGRYFWNQRSENGYFKAISYFKQAIAKSPEYAQAYAGLADAYALLGSNPTRSMSRREALTKAREAAVKALELDDKLAEAHTSLAFISWHYDWNWAVAENEFRRALELNPSYPTAHHWYAIYLLTQGRTDQAFHEIRRAQEIDPLSLIINTDLSEMLFFDRRYDDAIVQAKRTLEMDPNFVLAWGVLGEAYLLKHDFTQAQAVLRKGMGISGGDLLLEGTLGISYAQMRQEHRARAVLQDMRRKAGEPHMTEFYVSIANVYALLGDKDNAFLWLEKAYLNRDGALTLMKVSPWFDAIRSDPRFTDLVRRIGLAQ